MYNILILQPKKINKVHVSSKYHTHMRAKCERAICALCRVVTQIFMHSTFAPLRVCIRLLTYNTQKFWVVGVSQVWPLIVTTFASSGPNQEFDILTSIWGPRSVNLTSVVRFSTDKTTTQARQNESQRLSKSCHFDKSWPQFFVWTLKVK